jgi:hypothetical protein
MCTDGVLVNFVDDTTKHDHASRVSDLQQLHFEERNRKQAKSKLLLAKLNCQECEKNLIACESTYNKHLGDQIVLERLQTFIVGYWSKLLKKIGSEERLRNQKAHRSHKYVNNAWSEISNSPPTKLFIPLPTPPH